MSSINWTDGQIRSRLVRYPDLKPCTSAFIDTRTPGSEDKENFTIIGPGVAENPEQYVHIDIPHGFNIGGARQPPGCVNSQHSHETAEVFIVHSGRWAFHLGPDGKDGSIELAPGDTISIPTGVFRGFENVGNDLGFLFAVLGGDDPGHVTWAPYVFDAASHHGLVLLENGSLIDTTKGELVPDGARVMKPTTAEDVARLRTLSMDEIAGCVVRADELRDLKVVQFREDSGIAESSIIGAASEAEQMPAGRMSWNHGFHVRRLQVEPGAATPLFRRDEAEVILMQRGDLNFEWQKGELSLHEGDVFTVPVGLPRRYRNAGTETALAYVVRAGNQPGARRPVDPAE